MIGYTLVMFFFVRATALSGRSDTAFPVDTNAQTAEGSHEAMHASTSQEATASGQDVPNGVYTSYLLLPRLHFSGTYRADVSTVNNKPHNFDTASFVPNNWQRGKQNGFNPRGSGEWSVSGSVTQVCYVDGHCMDDTEGNEKVEPLLGASISDGGNKSLAKLVDLDSEAQLFSEIWGWRFRIGDYFSADYTPVPFQYIWSKMNFSGGDSTYGAAYQSVLSNIRWIENKNGLDSPFVAKIREAMKNDNIDASKLSIRFNVDLYQTDNAKNNFTMGRITGTIGLIGTKSPPFFTLGRMMRALVNDFQDAPFYVDTTNKRVVVDFGNSLSIDQYGSILPNGLLVAVNLDNDTSLECPDNLLRLGHVQNTLPNWYRTTAGVQMFPASKPLSDDNMEKLAKYPLIVVEVNDTDCNRVLLAEDRDGVDIHPFSTWTFRKNPDETAKVQLLVTKFGHPLSNTNVKIAPCNCGSIFSGGPEVGQPPLPVQHPESTTDVNGIATFNIKAQDPQNKRGYIDGQLYPFSYVVEGRQSEVCSDTMCKNDPFKLLNSLIVILVWDNYTQKGAEPTWLDDVFPIFKQYANLYPVMADHFVDLADYYDVVNHRKAISGSMHFPMSHPNYMPATRDLSSSKRQVILEWLSKGKPVIGNPEHFYSVEHLQKDLQTALQLEHSTIPPYLTALASIKFSYNLEVQSVLKEVIIQEMMHMALVANILNAVGGQPSLYSKDFIPLYPSRLPGGVQPHLIVPIEKLSLGLIRNIFMKIEQPELEQKRMSSFQHAFAYTENLKLKKMVQERERHCQKDEKGESCSEQNYLMFMSLPPTDSLVDDKLSSCFTSPSVDQTQKDSVQEDDADDDLPEEMPQGEGAQHWRKKRRHFPRHDRTIVKHNNTIGGFYIHILNTLGNLTDCGKNNSIFTGNRSRQVTNVGQWSVHGHSLEVYDYITAVEAIKLIIEQGEGSSPCNPVAWDTEAGKSLSHYFLFQSVAENREIRVRNKTRNQTKDKNDGGSPVLDYTELCNGTYHFTGPKIPFDADGVWPIIPNPRMTKYNQGSKAYIQAGRFNKVYTKLLKSLDNVFNGYPETLKDALGLMYSVDLHLRKLVHTPIDDDGHPDVGPNAGPTFHFTP